jgi:hypothetical protein
VAKIYITKDGNTKEIEVVGYESIKIEVQKARESVTMKLCEENDTKGAILSKN